jgi:hypothetical protein
MTRSLVPLACCSVWRRHEANLLSLYNILIERRVKVAAPWAAAEREWTRKKRQCWFQKSWTQYGEATLVELVIVAKKWGNHIRYTMHTIQTNTIKMEKRTYCVSLWDVSICRDSKIRHLLFFSPVECCVWGPSLLALRPSDCVEPQLC